MDSSSKRWSCLAAEVAAQLALVYNIFNNMMKFLTRIELMILHLSGLITHLCLTPFPSLPPSLPFTSPHTLPTARTRNGRSDVTAELPPQLLDVPQHVALVQLAQTVPHLNQRTPRPCFLECRQSQSELQFPILHAAVEQRALVGELQVFQLQELKGRRLYAAAQLPPANFELHEFIKVRPLSLHFPIEFAADGLVGLHDGLAAAELLQLFSAVGDGLAGEFEEGERDGHAHEEGGEGGRDLLVADPRDEQPDGGGGYRRQTLLQALRLDLDVQFEGVVLEVLLGCDPACLEPSHELLQHEPLLPGDHFADGLGGEQRLALPDHLQQPLHLFVVLLADVLVAADFELQTAGLVDPVDALAPRRRLPAPLEHRLELRHRPRHLLLVRVDHQVVVLRQQRDQRLPLRLPAPGQLRQEAEQSLLVRGVALGQTAHVEDAVQTQLPLLQLLQDAGTDAEAVVDAVQAGDVQHPETHLLAVHFEGGTLVEGDLRGDFLEAVGHADGGVAGEEFGGGALAGPRPPQHQQVKLLNALHSKINASGGAAPARAVILIGRPSILFLPMDKENALSGSTPRDAYNHYMKYLIATNADYFQAKVSLAHRTRPQDNRLKMPCPTGLTVYRKDFTKKKASRQAAAPRHDLSVDCTRGVAAGEERVRFDGKTTYQKEFKYHPVRTESHRVLKKRLETAADDDVPRFFETQNKMDFLNWAGKNYVPSMRPEHKPAVTNAPFTATSIYRSDFEGKGVAPTPLFLRESSFPKFGNFSMVLKTNYSSEFSTKAVGSGEIDCKPKYYEAGLCKQFKGNTEYKREFMRAKRQEAEHGDSPMPLADLQTLIIDL